MQGTTISHKHTYNHNTHNYWLVSFLASLSVGLPSKHTQQINALVARMCVQADRRAGEQASKYASVAAVFVCAAGVFEATLKPSYLWEAAPLLKRSLARDCSFLVRKTLDSISGSDRQTKTADLMFVRETINSTFIQLNSIDEERVAAWSGDATKNFRSKSVT